MHAYCTLNYVTCNNRVLALTVNDAGQPQQQQFASQPQDTTVNKGQLVVLKCIVQNLIGNVQWVRDGFGLGPGPTYDGYPRYRVDNNSLTGKLNQLAY